MQQHVPWHEFTEAILAFGKQHGRKHLPWQWPQTPYSVWISEIMLQQTQVKTVIPFFERFVKRFPHVSALAAASLSDVMADWSGLGYYARARRLHASAQLLVSQGLHDLPHQLEDLMALPGIGRSTAGAILSLGLNAPYPILDGNVKRVLLRVLGWKDAVTGAVVRRLWEVSENALSRDEPRLYNQTMMDLGALVCTPAPACTRCPVRTWCTAHREGCARDIPRPAIRRVKAVDSVWHIGVRDDGYVWLVLRDQAKIWGHLWCFPEQQPAGWGDLEPIVGEAFHHGLTHRVLRIQPRYYRVPVGWSSETASGCWCTVDAALSRGVPAPVRVLLGDLQAHKTAAQPVASEGG